MPEVSASHWHRPDRLKICVACKAKKPLSGFYRYAYTTQQGRRSHRYNSRCVECARASRRERYAKSGAQDRATSTAWKQRNSERVSDYNRTRQQDPEVRAMKARHQRQRKARMRAQSGDTPEIRAIYAEAVRVEAIIQACPVFDLPELGKKIHVDHIVPLARGGAHSAENLQLLAAGLNMRKGVSCPR